MGAFIDLTGQKFGRLTVIERAKDHIQTNGRHIVCWLCKCECGNTCEVRSADLKRGATVSCGCYGKEQRLKASTKHQHTHTKLYSVWSGMIQRCTNSKARNYHNYGGKGITVCDEWLHDFQAFYDWAMASGYADNLTIDRIDNNKGYSPDNCRWATRIEQNNNTSRNHLITYNGKTQTIAQWAREYNIPYKRFCQRINQSHWNIEKALNTP